MRNDDRGDRLTLSRPRATAALVLAAVLLAASLIGHGPAWLVGSLLSAFSQDTLSIGNARGVWYRGEGQLMLKGSEEALPLSWEFSLEGIGIGLLLKEGMDGRLSCSFRQGCTSSGISGSLPGNWLVQMVPAVRSVGLEGNLDWQLRRLQLDPRGGSLELDWKTGELRATRLEITLGWYGGSLKGLWSAAEQDPRLDLEVHSTPPAGRKAPLEVQARGRLGRSAVDVAGQVNLPDPDPRYSRLLQMVGLNANGGAFRYGK